MPTLYLDDQEIAVSRIGKGQFSRVYASADDVVYALVDGPLDLSKEAMSTFWGEPLPHMPQIERENDAQLSSISGEFTTYRMPRYSMQKTGLARRQAQILNSIHSSLPLRVWRADMTPHYQQLLSKAKNYPEITPELIAALEEMINRIMNYGTYYGFDFKMANLAQDDSGLLILLDIFWPRKF